MKITAFILAGGKGSRIKGPLSKIELPIAGIPCFQILLKTISQIPEVEPYIIGSPDFQKVQKCHAIQQTPLGTGHAVKIGCENWKKEKPDLVLVLYADVPLIKQETINQMILAHKKRENTITILTFREELPNSYGRVVEENEVVTKIIDARDEKRPFSGAMLAHSGIMLIEADFLWSNIDSLKPSNEQKELYLTDFINIANKKGRKVESIRISKEEAQGLNTWKDWISLEKIYQEQLREHWFQKGALVGEHTQLYYDTKLAPGVVVENFVTFGPNVVLKENVQVLAHTYISESVIDKNTTIGPFAHVHKNSKIGENNKIGNFVETKEASTKEGVRAKHMTYLGNVSLEEHVNVGGGVVFANYDGFSKKSSEIEKNVFIGANCTFISPLKIEEGSYIAAGSTITRSVPPFSLAFGRTRQKIKENALKNTKQEK